MVRNDRATVDELLERGPDRLVVSPGPCTPAEAGISVEAVRAFAEAGTPVLGVCLGHQALVEAFGGRVDPGRADPRQGRRGRARWPRHLRRAAEPARRRAATTRSSPTRGCPTSSSSAPAYGDVVMGVRHASFPPRASSSIRSPCSPRSGKLLLANFLGDGAPADAERDRHPRDRRRLRRRPPDRRSRRRRCSPRSWRGAPARCRRRAFLIALRAKGETVPSWSAWRGRCAPSRRR